MDYSQALQRLHNHADFPGSDLPETESFLFELFQAERHSRLPKVQPFFQDILSCFAVINRSINTDHPSESTSNKKAELSRHLVAYVSTILSEGWRHHRQWFISHRFTEEFCLEFAALLVQLGIAWDAVLAGDIDDIGEHTRLEFLARDGYAPDGSADAS